MKNETKISESLKVALILAISGGFMDAYSYLYRGGVFANAQTGNILLIGVNIANGDLKNSINHMLPVILFGMGIYISQIAKFNNNKSLHWKEICLIIEIISLIVVAFIPVKYNLLAVSMISFVCGIQVQTFRSLYGNAYSTTMCIGNLRGGIHEISEYLDKKEVNHLKNGLIYFLVILFFTLGAILGSKLGIFLGLHSILVSTFFLIIVFIILFTKKRI